MKINSAQCAFWVVRWPCIQNGPVSDTIYSIRRRGGYRGILREEGVDTGAYETVVDVPESWESLYICGEVRKKNFGPKVDVEFFGVDPYTLGNRIPRAFQNSFIF